MSSLSTKNLAKELLALKQEEPEGIKIFLNENDISEFSVLIDGPESTPFNGGSFKIKVKVTDDYPSIPPKCTFVSKIFHPNVSPTTGEICVNTLKKDWKREYGIKHALLTIKCLLIVPNAESALNEEAGRLILEDYEKYEQRAKLMTSIHAVTSASSGLNVCKKPEEKEVSSENVDENNAATAVSSISSTIVSPSKKRPISNNASSSNAAITTNTDVKKKQDLKKKSLKRL